MIVSKLKLTNLGHCYVILPKSVLAKFPKLKPGYSIISIKSVQNEAELCVIWNGQFSNDEIIQLDLSFAQSNNIQDEIAVISQVEDASPMECSSCRAELLDDRELNIISQHSDANVLDHCKLIYKDLIFPIWLSQSVRVLVKVVHHEPEVDFVTLTKWTKMQFQHSIVDTSRLHESGKSDGTDQNSIECPVPLISCSLGINCDPKFYLGSMLIQGEPGSGKSYYIKNLLRDYRSFHCQIYNCKEFRGKRPENVKKKLDEILTAALENHPSIIALDNIDSFVSKPRAHDGEDDAKGQEAIYHERLLDAFCNFIKQIERQREKRVALVASCRGLNYLDEKIAKPIGRQYFNKLISLECPDLQTRAEILKVILSEHKQVQSILSVTDYENVANKCGSFLPSDLKKLTERAVISACSKSSLDFNPELVQLTVEDFLDSIEGLVPASLRNISLEAKSDISFDDIGGMDSAKSSLLKIVLLPLKYPKLFRRCPIRPQTSILLYGPPGCGKTILAEALTNLNGLNSIHVRGPELLSKYIGASEAAVRDLFQRAEQAKPSIIFFDEFESIVSRRGSDSTGVTDRIVNQFLAIMDGVESLSKNVYIVAATSRPDMIDPAILRPGRLDKHIYCPLPDREDRLKILQVLTRDIDLNLHDKTLAAWAKKLEHFSGADIKSLLYTAQLKALHSSLDSPGANKTKKNDVTIRVTQKEMEESFNEMKSEVENRYMTLHERYPEKFNQSTEGVAIHATLA